MNAQISLYLQVSLHEVVAVEAEGGKVRGRGWRGNDRGHDFGGQIGNVIVEGVADAAVKIAFSPKSCLCLQ